MAQAETEEEAVGFTTNEQKMEYWQMCRVCIDYRNHRIEARDALRQFSYWSQLPPKIAFTFMKAMSADSNAVLRKAFPDFVGKEPEYEDLRKATRNGNLAKRRAEGCDSTGRVNGVYKAQLERSTRRAD